MSGYGDWPEGLRLLQVCVIVSKSSDIKIEGLGPEAAREALPDLIELLQDAVLSGASVGFLPPLSQEEARLYWECVIEEVGANTRVLLCALKESRIVGAVQFALATKPNAKHRAEVQRLIVHRNARRQGIGQTLMREIETVATRHGRSLLVLDTRQGDPSERLYRKLGYLECGTIPNYAESADGSLHATVFFYRILNSQR